MLFVIIIIKNVINILLLYLYGILHIARKVGNSYGYGI